MYFQEYANKSGGRERRIVSNNRPLFSCRDKSLSRNGRVTYINDTGTCWLTGHYQDYVQRQCQCRALYVMQNQTAVTVKALYKCGEAWIQMDASWDMPSSIRLKSEV